MRRFPSIAAALLLIAAVLPAAALAQGNSAIDQYTEQVPGAGGDKPSAGGREDSGDSGGGAEGSGQPLPDDISQALQARGSDGGAAAALAQATAPQEAEGLGPGSEGSNGQGETGATATRPESSSGGRPSAGDVVGGVTGGDADRGGMGVWLSVILATTFLAAIVLGIARLRRGPSEPTHA